MPTDSVCVALDRITEESREIAARMTARRQVQWSMTRKATDEVKKNTAKENRNRR